ncbi:MAG: endo-1,4-beta-xylanase [Lachnospiraceae bacterium]|nr:endo-1,4-beta-xylanase [Lachnospiraceae bacterium]
MNGRLRNGDSFRRGLGVILALALVLGSIVWTPMGKVKAAGENLIQNPNFESEDLSDWSSAGATLTRETQDQPIFDNVKTYATISGRAQSYQGFWQDVSDKVQAGKEYEVSFYVKLSDEYASLDASQRQVFFGPQVLENGITKYLSRAYSPEVKGDLLMEVPVGQWVKLSGTFSVGEDVTEVIVRFQEESSQGKLSYSITGVSMTLKEGQEEQGQQQPVEETDIPILRDAITAELGEGTIVGMVTHPVNNKKEWNLLTQHANAITAGNEFKPDAHFGYSNGRCPGMETVTFNGKKLLVPKIDYTRGEQVLNAVLKYNEANPDNQIKVRGHVLVWHAQTPEWFFHEDYDPTKDYVSKEVMDQRLEWYVCSLFTHYMGKDSKYKDLFYGWDVVNEACADSTAQVYRDDKGGNDKLTDSTHSSKSSWWHIYQSNEFIINAFKYANKYAPANVELYYNDYNDSWPVKVPNICALLKAIKEQEGAPGVGTRIDAFGMQAHYGLDSFDAANFEAAARQYLDIVGKIQLTELDMGASANYDGTAATVDQEYMDQALVYQKIYEILKKLDKEPGYEIGGITFWGVTDPNSWLQNKSDLGGGSDGLRSQCPLLFDGNYEAKPAFWAFVDPSKIKIVQKKVEARRTYNGEFKDGASYSVESGSLSATVVPLWDEDGVSFQVEVKDKSLDGEGDYVTVYVTEDLEGKDGAVTQKYSVDRTKSVAIGGGYKPTVKIPLSEMRFGKQFLFDIVVTDGSGEKLGFNDIQMNQETSTRNFAICTLKPALTRVAQGTPVIDGEMDDVWKTTQTLWLNVNTGSAKCAAKAKVLWDTKKIYVYAEVQDSDVSVAGKEAYEQDSLEVYLDENHAGGITYGKDDKRYRINAENAVTCLGSKASEKKVESKVKKTENGYVIEAAFEWTDAKPKVHTLIGFDLRINDATADGTRIGTLSWADATGEAGTNPSCFGTIKLAAESEALEEGENPDLAISQAPKFVMDESAKPEEQTQASENGEGEPAQPIGNEKEVPDNPKEAPWTPILIVCGVIVIGGIGAFFGVKASKKKEKNEEKNKKK